MALLQNVKAPKRDAGHGCPCSVLARNSHGKDVDILGPRRRPVRRARTIRFYSLPQGEFNSLASHTRGRCFKHRHTVTFVTDAAPLQCECSKCGRENTELRFPADGHEKETDACWCRAVACWLWVRTRRWHRSYDRLSLHRANHN